MRTWAALLLVATAVACVPSRPRPTPTARGPVVRVLLATVTVAPPPADLRPASDGLVRFQGKRYRGTLRAVPTDSGVLVINEVPLEEYLLGVVALEMGERPREESAALEAQAIAARSFAITRAIAARTSRSGSSPAPTGVASRAAAQRNVNSSPPFDLRASVADQVYGGVDAERPNASAAVRATAGLVLAYANRVIIAPYHATCGGETAAAEEVWRTRGEPFLQRVSDRIPGRDARHYCDAAPRFRWERSFSASELDTVLRRYLATVTTAPSEGIGPVQDVRVLTRTPSGRVGTVEFRSPRGAWAVRGNDARSVLRSSAGELLPSPYFSITVQSASDGAVARLQLRGQGFGHGVGMCQWGAIGRARAGQNVRTILATYFPGTTVRPVSSLASFSSL